MRYFEIIGLLALCLVDLTVAGLTSSALTTTTGLSTNPNDVHFYLFKDPKNMDNFTEIKYRDVLSLEKSGYRNETDCSIFVIHGFLSSAFNLAFPRNVIKAYLRESACGNYIAVDWSKLSTPMLDDPLLYPIVAERNVPIVGKRVGEMIHFMMNNSAISGPSKVHCVGHSLGAHVSGEVGRYIKAQIGSFIGRISGLDPAGPLFQNVPADRRLSSDDSNFVDTYHTSLTLGYIGDIGHCSFYPNGGLAHTQPNCYDPMNPVNQTAICPHNKVGEYFAYSILRRITACKCSDVWYNCHPNCNNTAIFGEYTLPTVRGSYYLHLNTTEKDLN